MAVLLTLCACGHQAVVRPTVMPDLPAGDRSVLAGEWEYEEGAATLLRLDEQGNGAYDWKEGRFETTQFADHTWTGNWIQKENDREGGFLITLSPDYSEGDGIWWYVRIGSDRAPSEKGGRFHVSKKASLTNHNETPPAP